ncbi:MAG: YdcF family protein [Spirochaetes bacterium]|nr:YdcF family protein [Spirochaetota bacterium]
MKVLKLICATAVIVALSAGGAAWSISAHMTRRAAPLVRRSVDECAPAQAAVLLGAGVYSGKRVSAVLYDRIVSALALYRSGRVKKILVTGDHGTRYYDEVNTILHWLRRYGVPQEDIFTDYAGRRVYRHLSRYSAREIPARVKDFLYAVVLKPAPRFMGERIPITGNGRSSRDHEVRE